MSLVLLPAALSLMLFWLVQGIRPSAWDIVGSCVALGGMLIIMLAPARPG